MVCQCGCDCDETILVPYPVVPVPESNTVRATKFFGWLTAMLLSASVFVALLALTNDRDTLQERVEAQAAELECRSESTIDVYRAIVDKQNAESTQNIIVGEMVVAYIQEDSDAVSDLVDELAAANESLKITGIALDEAMTEQQESVTTCEESE